jgi:nitronate monooxygenase
MGIAVSNWQLAKAVAARGQLGVVSGTGIDAVLPRRLQMGDPGGHLRAAFDAFPIQEIAKRIWDQYFIEGGKASGAAFKSRPLPNINPSKAWLELAVLANFVEVWLAKQGHNGLVGINLLEKIQLPTLPSLFGAMMAGVDFVLMGAGIPRQIPAALDSLAKLQATEYKVDVSGAVAGDQFTTAFDPKSLADWPFESVKRPKFLAIVSSAVLAITLLRKCTPPVDGFVIELPVAGGHNAPPRGGMKLDEQGEPIYGEKDVPDLKAIAELGAPFWLAGAYGAPDMLDAALEAGAQGVQVGTAFAFCNESGLDGTLKGEIVKLALSNDAVITTDPLASPTGFPFKVLQKPGTLSEQSVFDSRERVCDMGYLRTLYRKDDGTVGYRCPAEPVEDYVRKGGDEAETEGRKCICNGLMATIGLGQWRKDGSSEPPIVTAGNDIVNLRRYVPEGKTAYSVDDVLRTLLGAGSKA